MRRHSIMRPRRTLGLAAGLAVLAAGAWTLAASSAAQDSDAARPQDPAPGTAALRVAIQPETGDLVPAAADDQLGALGLPKPAGDLVVRTRTDGGLHADIRGHFMSYSVARVSSEGGIEQTCVSDPRTAQDLLQTSPTSPVVSGGEER